MDVQQSAHHYWLSPYQSAIGITYMWICYGVYNPRISPFQMGCHQRTTNSPNYANSIHCRRHAKQPCWDAHRTIDNKDSYSHVRQKSKYDECQPHAEHSKSTCVSANEHIDGGSVPFRLAFCWLVVTLAV